MINTIDIKAHLHDVFEIGNPSADKEHTMLVLGSCRTVPYLNYLNQYNQNNGNPYKIFCIEPNNYHWSIGEVPVDLDATLEKLQTNERILSVLSSTGIFIHEHYANFGMFNTNKDSTRNVYQFGMEPKMDIAIPNFHNHFILENDFKDFGSLPDDYLALGEAEIEKFCGVCELSSFPEFANVFRKTWRNIRYFWRPNHVTAKFTHAIFRLMDAKFLNLEIDELDPVDLFQDPHTNVTARDREGYNLKW